MPTYEYECRACAHTFEAFQAMSDDPLSGCPSCGCSVRRIINGGTGIIFKGTGFYANDSRKPRAGEKTELSAKKDGDPAPASPQKGEAAAAGGSSAPTPAAAPVPGAKAAEAV
ncbi:MAG: FmdB family zinc ribbon protein [Rectinemataceae bacterium]